MSFTFKSPAISKNIWTLCFRDKEEMNRIYYEGKSTEDNGRLFGITEFVSSTIYIDKDLDGFVLAKTLRHELVHVYLWETGQQDRIMNEEEVCEFMSIAIPTIQKTTDEILLRLKEGLYKNGE